MAYDPIIHFYDDPGHPYWPSNNGSSGGGGGGEGVVLGSMQHVPALTSDVPVVGEGCYASYMNVYSINVGEQKVVDSGDNNVNSVYLIASGASCTLCTELGGEEVTLNDISVSAYVITKELVNNDFVYTSVAPWDGEFVLSILGRLDGFPYLLISYTVPELSDGDLLMVLDTHSGGGGDDDES